MTCAPKYTIITRARTHATAPLPGKEAPWGSQGGEQPHEDNDKFDQNQTKKKDIMSEVNGEAEVAAEVKGGNAGYDENSIQALEGVDAVRKRPGMYIGNTDDGSGLHHMVYEVVDNSIDEALAGHCDTITVVIEDDMTVSVEDNGRGIPTGLHPQKGVSAAEVILTVLHAGGKFDQNSYKVSGGLHGVGVSVVNFLSSKLTIDIRREGKLWRQNYTTGHPDAPIDVVGTAKTTGTKITFQADEVIFPNQRFSFGTLSQRLRELSYLNSGVAITIIDERDDRRNDFKFEGGIKSFVQGLSSKQQPLHEEPIHFVKEVEDSGVTVEASLQWTDSYREEILCYTNNIHNRDGGTHLSGLRGALTRSLNAYAAEHKLTKTNLSGDDVREGLTAVLSVKMPEPKFSSQTKDKLVSDYIKGYVESSVNEQLAIFFEENPSTARQIVNKAVGAQRARAAARKAREIARKSAMDGLSSLPGKLADCQSKDPDECELFIVEGDSAGGSAKQGRDRHYQAILPLRGKILNVERARFDRMLASNEITALISALGCGIGSDHFDIEKLRYKKIAIMTDADVDGSHIRTLLLTFFYRQMPELIEQGYLYIAQPPLYGVKKGKGMRYLKDEKALNEFLIQNAVSSVRLKAPSGDVVEGDDFESYIGTLLSWRDAMNRMGRRADTRIIEAAIKAGLAEEDLNDEDLLQDRINTILEDLGDRFDTVRWIAPDIEPDEDLDDLFQVRWNSRVMGMSFESLLDRKLLGGRLYKSLVSAFDAFKAPGLPLTMENPRTAKEMEVHDDINELLNAILLAGRKGQSIQRYKGLGEMNPDQLWETTMDSENRSMLQVRVEDQEHANLLFTQLMGDDVEGRRDFLERKALSVRNLDV